MRALSTPKVTTGVSAAAEVSIQVLVLSFPGTDVIMSILLVRKGLRFGARCY